MGASYKSHGDHDWLSARDLSEPEAMRLFCLPHAGSGASGFYRWRASLRGAVAICPFHLPGRESRLAEPPIVIFEELLQQLRTAIEPHLDRPYILFGHSMGASLAFELARTLEREGMRKPTSLIVSGRESPESELRKIRFANLSDDQMVTALDEVYDGNLTETLVDPEMRSIYLSILRADLEIVDSYEFKKPETLLQCPLEVLGASSDASTTLLGLQRWQHATASNKFKLTMFPGSHFYLLGSERQNFLDHLKGRCIDYGLSAI